MEYGDGDQPWLRIGLRDLDRRRGFSVAERVAGRWGPTRLLWADSASGPDAAVTIRFAGGAIWLSAGTMAQPSFRPALMLPAALTLRLPATIRLDAAAPAVRPATAAPASEGALEAWLEVAGRLPGTGFCLLLGWLRDRTLEATSGPVAFGSRVGAPAPGLIAFHDRADLQREGVGLLALAPDTAASDGPAMAWAPPDLLINGRAPLRLRVADVFQVHDAAARAAMARRILATARGADRPAMERHLARAYTGSDTLTALSLPVRLELAGILPSTEGALLRGALTDPCGAVVAIRLASEAALSHPLQRRWLPAGRPDLPGGPVGFVARLDLPPDHPAGCWLEIELANGETGCTPLSAPVANGLSAVVEVLSEARIPGGGLRRAFDEILGPPLVAHHRTLLARPPAVEEIAFGTPPQAPRASVVVPLHGRVDFLAWQLALFSAGGLAADEIVYVLDGPEQRDAALGLAQASHARFGLPFRLLLAAERRGFGPTCNLGLGHARGAFVCFLNSDVFPLDTLWLDRLLAPLDDAAVGVAGALLVFPDGSTQHAGMRYESIPEMGGWLFPTHPGKGLRFPQESQEEVPVPALTGACLAMQRALATELGGFDPDFVIGDFEDADLCERVRARGLGCVLVPSARLVHFERQSQGAATESWRRNLTLLNAWSFARRWGEGPACR
jgi:GT2 family glycosyltransferase